MINRRTSWCVMLLLLFSQILAGCAFTPQLQRVAVDHNRLVSTTENKITLLNIVRASERFPLHFTTFSELTGNAQLTVGTSLGASLTDGSDSFSPSLSANARTSPTFRLAVLSTEKFQRGIQQPIGPDLVAYYIDAGWRDQLIMALFIERIDIVENVSGKMTGSIVNDAKHGANFEWVLCNYNLKSMPTATSQPLAEFRQIFDADIMSNKELSSKNRRDEIKEFLNLLSNEEVALQNDTLVLKGKRNAARVEPLDVSRCGQAEVPLPNNLPAGFDKNTHKLVPSFRSTLGIIYFLGEYVRSAKQNSSQVYHLPERSLSTDADVTCDRRSLIDVRTGKGRGFVDTQFRDRRYFIPKISDEDCNGGFAPARSMQVVALVQQLLNLHKSAEDLPTTLSVSGSSGG